MGGRGRAQTPVFTNLDASIRQLLVQHPPLDPGCCDLADLATEDTEGLLRGISGGKAGMRPHELRAADAAPDRWDVVAVRSAGRMSA